MKPITAEDLVVGGKYVYKDKLHTYCGLCEQNDFVFYDENYYYIFLKDLSHVTPYHEPNQTTMNTDYTEQPFNLETALKHPDWVRTRDGREIDFIKKYPNQIFEFNIVYVTKCGCVDIVNCNGLSSTFGREHNNDLILRMPYQTVWFNVYKNTGYSSKEEADGVACPSDLRIACVPVKIPAI
jgi:hypothetical protein